MNTHYLRTRSFTKTIKQLAFLLLLLCIGFSTKAQTRYWVGGSGTWTNTTSWSASSGGAGGASVPISSNDVVFDSGSGFAAGNATITMPTGASLLCKSITFSCPVAPRMTGAGTLDVYGDMTLQTGMNINAWTGNLTFYTDPVTPGLTHTLTTANNIFYNTNVKFNKNVVGIDGNYVVNGIYNALGTTSITLLNKTNTVTFNQVATFSTLNHIVGTANLMTGFGNSGTINTNSNGSVFKCYGNGIANAFNFGGEVYFNAGNTAAGNTYTFANLFLQYTQTPSWEVFDFNNCTIHINSQYSDAGGNISLAQMGTINAAGSLLHFTSAAANIQPGPFTYNNIQVDDNLSASSSDFVFYLPGFYTIASHTTKPIFNSVIIDRNCRFQFNYNSPQGVYPYFNTLLQFTAGHKYYTIQSDGSSMSPVGNQVKFNIAPAATLSMIGTCAKPITLTSMAFEFGAGVTVNSDYLITNGITASGTAVPYNAGANSIFIPLSTKTNWTIGFPTHRNLVWVGAIPSSTITVAQYGNWGDGNNWVDVTSNPTWTSNALIAPGNPSLTPTCPPTWRDSVIMPDKSYINCNNPVSYCEGMNWIKSGRIYGTSAQDLEIWGSLFLSPTTPSISLVGMVNDFGGTVKFRSEKRGTGNWRNWITTNNQEFDYGVLFNSNDGLGEWVLKDSLKTTTSAQGITDPDCNSYLLEVRAGHLHTGTAWCVPGNGQTIYTRSMYLHSGAISLYDSDVHITGIQGWHSGLMVERKPGVIGAIGSSPTLEIYVNAGTSNFILHNEEGPNVTGSGGNLISANFGVGHRWYDITLNMPTIGSYTSTAYTGATHALIFRQDTVRHITAAYNTYPLITANSGGYAGGLISKLDLQNSNKLSYISAAVSGGGYANIDNMANVSIDTLLATGSVNFYIKTNIRSYVKLSPGKTYNLGTTSSGAGAVTINLMGASSTTLNPFYPIQCPQPGFTYTNSILDANGTCIDPITINNGSFSVTTTAMSTTTLSNLLVTDNTVVGSGAPLYYSNSNLSGTTTGWSGTPNAPRMLRWKDASSLAGNSAMWNNSNYWELVSKSGPTTYSVVAPAPQCPPTKIDSVLFDNTSFSANNQIVDVNTGNASNIIEIASIYWRNITAGTNPQFSSLATQNLSIYDNIEFHANMVQNFKGPILFRGTPTAAFPKSYITCSGKAFLNNITFKGDAATKNWSQKDAFFSPYNAVLAANPTFSLAAGSYSTMGFPMNIAQFTSYNGTNTLTPLCNLSIANSSITINYQANNWYDAWIVGYSNSNSISTAFFTLSAVNSSINIVPTAAVSAGAIPRFLGGGKKYNNLTFTTNYGGSINRGGNGLGDEFNVVVFTGTVNVGGTGTPNSIGDNFFSLTPDQCRIHQLIANGSITVRAESCVFDSILMNQGGNILGNTKYNKYVYFTDAKTYTFGSDRVQWFKNNCQVDLIGSAGNKIQLYSSNTGQQAYFRKDSAYFCADYVNMRDIWAIGNGNNPAACASYTNAGPVNTNCAPLASYSTHAVSSCDTITDLASSCGPWTTSFLSRGRADFNAGANADLTQGNNQGWANRGYPPVPSLTLASYTTAICPTESVVLSFSGTGYVPFTLFYNTSTPSSTTTIISSTLQAIKTDTNTGVYTYTANCNCDGIMTVLSTTTTNTSFPLNLAFTCPTELDSYISSSTQLTSYNPSTGAFSYTTSVYPNQNTQYSLGYLLVDRCFNSKSAAGTGTVNVTIKPSPSVISAVSSPTTICNAVPFNLNASATGANTYTLFPTPTGTASPTAMTSYTVGAAVNGSVTIAAGTYTTGSTATTYTAYAAATTSLGCTSLTRTPVQITINPTPSVAITSNSIACFGNATGAVSYTATGGAGSGYSISPSITSLTAGVYNYTVTDANGCKTNTTATITQPSSALSAVASNTDNTSCATPNGSAIASASGGTSGYTYLWQGGQTTPGITAQTGGTYTLIVTDANLCTYTTQATIANPSAPVVTASSNTNSICSGNNITITPGGGATIYTITPSIGTATVVSGATIFTPSVSTNYAVVGTNSTSCLSNTVNVSVTVNTTPTVAITAASPTICAGQNTTLNLSGASTYTLLNTGSPVSSGAIVSPTTSTTYSVQGSTPSCTGAFTGQLITVNPLPVVTAVASNTSICSGNTASLTAGGATTYTWISTGSTNTVITVSPANSTNYIVSGTDANNCSNTQTVGLVVNPTPTVNISTATPTICAGETATLTAATANTYAWSTTSTANTTTVMPTGTTVYTVTGTNTVGSCTTTAQYTVTVNAKPDLALTNTTSIACLGDANGTATVTTTSGTAGYNYTWTGSASTVSVATGLAAGNHTAVVTDNKGCKDTLVLTIAAPSASLSTAIATATTGCNLSNGTATLTPTGGWNTGYTYVWQSSPSTTNTATGYAAGSYTAQVTDANGCKKVQNFTITNPAPPTITALASSPSICSGGITTITPNGAVSYSITGTAVSSPTTGTSFTVNPTSSTSYSISGTDANNCVSSQISVPVTVNPTPTVAIAATSGTICSGQTTTLTAATANNYSWSTGNTGNSISIAPNTNTVITVTGTNTAGSCTATAQYSITVNPTPTVAITASSGTLCSGQTTTLTAATANNYSWSTGNTGNSISIAPNTNTVITVTGTNTAGNCTATAQYSITVNPTPTVAIAATSGTLCSGQTTTLTAATANNYSWSTGNTGNSISIAPNTNTVITVTGTNTAGSCTATAQYSITVNPTPTVAITASSGTLCSGQTTTLTAATANNYSWSTGGTGNSISIAPNTNTVITVTGTNTAGSCTAIAQYSITVNPTPTVAIAASSSTLCSGQTVTLTAATANNYSWSTGASVNTTTLAPLTNTIVTVTGTNTVGSCTASAQFTLNVSPLPVIASSTITNVSCYGLNNGSALFTPASGTPGYTITGTGASGTTATNLSPANYTYTITDALGCKSTSTLSITQPTAALLTTAAQTATNTSCTSPDGVATPTINGGTAGYTITPSSGTVSGNNITGLPTGTHTYTITDANGCIASNSVQISGATGITSALAAQTNVLCYGNTTASISVQGSGEASGAYNYSLTPVTATTSALSNSNGTFTGLGQGTYSVLVIGAVSNCISSQNVSISQPTAALALTANTNSVLCNGGNALATASVTGGTPSYTLNWNGTNSSATTHTFTAGTYTVNATDINGCSTATQTLTITQPTVALALAASSNSVLCNGGSAITSATVTGGTPSYTLNWNGVSSTATTHTFTAGTYTLNAIDNNGCSTATQTLTITQPTAALVLAANSNSVLCNGGIATTSATVTGGTPSYTINWNGTNSSATTYTFTAGTYTVNAIDNNGCSSATQTLAIAQPTAALALAANSNSILCNGGNTIATATVTGGTPSYTLNWNGVSSTATTHTFTAGTYTVNVIDNNGCSSATQTLAISQPAQLSALITNTTSNSSCVTPNGSFTVNATGGTPGYTYNTSNSTGIFTGQATGTHSITVSDANACTYTLSAMISGVATPVISTATQTNVLCNGQNTGAAVITASSGTQPYTYNWTNSSANSNAITNVSQGIYIVTATDAGNCKVSYTFTITEPSAINAITTSMINPCVGQNNGSASIEVNGGTPNYTYSWANNGSTSNSITDVSEGQYTATITDANGCVFQYPVSLKAEDGISCTIKIPEIFSPNGDGKNDKWEIKGLENYPNNNVQVFNRWGDEVFKSNPYNNDWQGSNRGDKSLLGQGALPASTYYFILDLGNGDKPITGYVQLTK